MNTENPRNILVDDLLNMLSSVQRSINTITEIMSHYKPPCEQADYVYSVVSDLKGIRTRLTRENPCLMDQLIKTLSSKKENGNNENEESR